MLKVQIKDIVTGKQWIDFPDSGIDPDTYFDNLNEQHEWTVDYSRATVREMATWKIQDILHKCIVIYREGGAIILNGEIYETFDEFSIAVTKIIDSKIRFKFGPLVQEDPSFWRLNVSKAS